MKELGRKSPPTAAPLIENDLRQGLAGDDVAADVVHHLDLLAVAYLIGNLFERNVAALLGVVELATFVASDHSRHGLPFVAALRRDSSYRTAAFCKDWPESSIV